LNPAPGDARKEILFTRKGSTLYAILPVTPGAMLTVRDLRPARDARVSLLDGTRGALRWKQRGADVVVTLPASRADDGRSIGPRVVKIEGALP
jgi:alpha-L-fucosidase